MTEHVDTDGLGIRIVDRISAAVIRQTNLHNLQTNGGQSPRT